MTMQFNRADLADRAELVLPRDQPAGRSTPSPSRSPASPPSCSRRGLPRRRHLDGGLAAWKAAAGRPPSCRCSTWTSCARAWTRSRCSTCASRSSSATGTSPAAALLPSGEAWSRLEEVPADRAIAVVCGDQTRSAAVASMLQRAGRDVRLVMGGMVDWLERGYPVEREPARWKPAGVGARHPERAPPEPRDRARRHRRRAERALVVIPQGLAYAQLAGMPAYRGLYAAAVPPIAAACSRPRPISRPARPR